MLDATYKWDENMRVNDKEYNNMIQQAQDSSRKSALETRKSALCNLCLQNEKQCWVAYVITIHMGVV